MVALVEGEGEEAGTGEDPSTEVDTAVDTVEEEAEAAVGGKLRPPTQPKRSPRTSSPGLFTNAFMLTNMFFTSACYLICLSHHHLIGLHARFLFSSFSFLLHYRHYTLLSHSGICLVAFSQNFP